MKHSTKLSKTLCLLVCLFMGSAFTAAAADFMVDSICYNIIGENQVEVTSRDVKYTGEVIIPATVMNDGITYQVTRIGNNAFSGCSSMTLVGIPEGVTEIGKYAFFQCFRLENIDLPNSLVSIGRAAFMMCYSFTAFHVPRNLATIEYDALTYLENLAYYTSSTLNTHFKAVDGVLYSKDLTRLVAYPPAAPATTFDIPSTVTSLGDYCFCSSKLTQVNIPESVTWMDMNIFRNCKELVSVDLPDGITHMGINVFGSCTNLTSVHLPASLDTLPNSTFSYCTKLTTVTVPRNVSCISNQAFIAAENLKSVIIQEGSRLNEIGEYAFRECYSLETLIMPNTVTKIGNACFYQCHNIKNLHVSENLTETGTGLFWDCYELTSAAIIGDIPEMKNLFYNCTSLKRLQIGSKHNTPGTTLLKNCTIARCNQLEYLELGANIDTLESSALPDIDNLKVLICWAPTPPRCDGYWHSFGPNPSTLNCVLYVPKASLEAYRTANEWKKFKTIVPIDDLGDVNGDSAVNMDDLTALINILLTADIAARDLPLADTNLDGAIGMDDLTALINILLTGN